MLEVYVLINISSTNPNRINITSEEIKIFNGRRFDVGDAVHNSGTQ